MNYVIEMFTMMNLWFWFGFASILIIMEMILGVNFFMLWLGVVAFGIGIVMAVYPALSWELQFTLFAIGSICSLMLWNLHLKNNPTVSDQPHLNRRCEQYVGRVVTLDTPIVNGRGRVSLDDSVWRIEGPDVPIGTTIKVIDIDGVILKVDRN